MKMKSVFTIAIVALLPIAAFAQTPPAPPQPPQPPRPPHPPGMPGHHEKGPKVPVTYLGVDTSQVPTVVSDQLGLAKGFGLVVDYVEPNSPAATAGVQQNDILKMLNDQILIEPSQLRKLLQTFPEGTEVTLTVLRKGQEQKLTAKLVRKEVSQRRGAFPGGNHDWHWDFDAAGDLDGSLILFGGPWDHAPFVVLVEEAGGRFSDLWGGRRLDTRTAIFSNGLVHDELRSLVAPLAPALPTGHYGNP